MRPVGGAGEIVEALPDPAPFGVVLVPFGEGLSAAEVYLEADRLAIGRESAELERLAGELRDAAVAGHHPADYLAIVRNDLEEAALSLRPEIGDALAALRGAAAEIAFVTGSGRRRSGCSPTPPRPAWRPPGSAIATRGRSRPRRHREWAPHEASGVEQGPGGPRYLLLIGAFALYQLVKGVLPDVDLQELLEDCPRASASGPT